MLTNARPINKFGAVIILTYYPMTAPMKIYARCVQFGLVESLAPAALYLTAQSLARLRISADGLRQSSRTSN